MFMNTQFVKVVHDLHCSWQGQPPRYRAYVEDELFAERTWIWTGMYLQEALQVQAPPGRYHIRFELLDSDNAELKIKNGRIEIGNAVLHKHGWLEILDENA